MMKPSRSNPKHSSSSPNLPPPKNSSSNNQSNQQVLLQHRKQIQSTLNQLHRLQSQIYQLNVPQNPHSSSPVKKQIKQLSYLYQNMAKPKVKNSLNVRSDDIQLAMRIMNKDWTPDTQLQPELSQQIKPFAPSIGKKSNEIDLLRKTNNISAGMSFSKGSSSFRNTIKNDIGNSLIDKSYKIPKKTIQQKFESLTHSQLNINFISKNEKSDNISTKQLYQFINFTECQNFDPVQKAYEMFLNENGEFDLNVYNHFNEVLGLPKIKNINTFIAAISQSFNQQQKKNQIIQRASQQKNPKQIQKKLSEPDKQQEKQSLYGKNSNKMTAKISLQQFKKVLQLDI